MSTTLNAEELAAKRWPRALCSPREIMMASENAVVDEFEQNSIREGYAAAVREVAQPLADERDAYRGHLLDLMGRVTHDFKCPLYDGHPSRANESCECGLSERLTAIKQLIEP